MKDRFSKKTKTSLASSFLLRFQEVCDPPCMAQTTLGTKTMTKVAMESADEDPSAYSYRAIPLCDQMERRRLSRHDPQCF